LSLNSSKRKDMDKMVFLTNWSK